MCSIIGVGERLHKVLGQIDSAHWTQVNDRCPLGCLLKTVVLLKRNLFVAFRPSKFSELVIFKIFTLATDFP